MKIETLIFLTYLFPLTAVAILIWKYLILKKGQRLVLDLFNQIKYELPKIFDPSHGVSTVRHSLEESLQVISQKLSLLSKNFFTNQWQRRVANIELNVNLQHPVSETLRDKNSHDTSAFGFMDVLSIIGLGVIFALALLISNETSIENKAILTLALILDLVITQFAFYNQRICFMISSMLDQIESYCSIPFKERVNLNLLVATYQEMAKSLNENFSKFNALICAIPNFNQMPEWLGRVQDTLAPIKRVAENLDSFYETNQKILEEVKILAIDWMGRRSSIEEAYEKIGTSIIEWTDQKGTSDEKFRADFLDQLKKLEAIETSVNKMLDDMGTDEFIAEIKTQLTALAAEQKSTLQRMAENIEHTSVKQHQLQQSMDSFLSKYQQRFPDKWLIIGQLVMLVGIAILLVIQILIKQ